MKKPAMRHPEDDQILRFADGELPARAARKIRTHLKACWECRAQLQEIEGTITPSATALDTARTFCRPIFLLRRLRGSTSIKGSPG